MLSRLNINLWNSQSSAGVIMGETYRDNLKRIEANKTQTKILNNVPNLPSLVGYFVENCKLSLQIPPVSFRENKPTNYC
jgi:hypothetical protein